MKIKTEKVRAILKQMPPLSHWPDRTQPFDPRNSEMITWATAQPEILNWIGGVLTQTRDCIRFDQEQGVWVGLDHNSQEPKA